MKKIGLNLIFALFMAIPIVFWLQPKPEGIGFVLLICFCLCTILSFIFNKVKIKRTSKNDIPSILIFLSFSLFLLNSCADQKLVSSRSFSKPNQKTPCEVGAYGYILLGKTLENNNQEQKRLELLARLFLRTFESKEDILKQGVYPKNIIVMYWPLKEEFRKKSITVSEMVRYYDYAKAKILLTKVNMAGSMGPILVAWNEPCQNRKQAMVFDLSKFNNEELSDAFLIWEQRISTDPKAWELGFNLEIIRVSFRHFVDKYGEFFFKTVMDEL